MFVYANIFIFFRSDRCLIIRNQSSVAFYFNKMLMIEKFKKLVLEGKCITFDQAVQLSETTDKDKLYQAAGEITRHFGSRFFDTCSIINARSGSCPENCKWCAQSAHHNTKIETYPLLDIQTCLRQAIHNENIGIKRFSLVTSGRKVSGRTLNEICNIYRVIGKQTKLSLCASLGLLNKEELQKLYDSGVTRYHCNLETAASYFPTLCTTHSQEEKIETIRAARATGMEICSGGIIGMGETMIQRIELAFSLRELNVTSIPINVLQPISGTPLENMPPLSEEDVLTTIAVFRFIHPMAKLRFAGGRGIMSKSLQEKALKIGINSAITGDMLTTISSKVEEDKKLFQHAGYILTDEI